MPIQKENQGLSALPKDLVGKMGKVKDPSSDEAIIQSSILQTVSPEHWDREGFQIVGKIEGDLRNIRGSEVRKGQGKVGMKKPVQTRFVQGFNADGEAIMEPYDLKLHGEW